MSLTGIPKLSCIVIAAIWRTAANFTLLLCHHSNMFEYEHENVEQIEEQAQYEDSANLTFEQVDKLNEVLHSVVDINGAGNFPTLNIQVKDLVQRVNSQLVSANLPATDIRLNGGAASYILCTEQDEFLHYNDIDLIFSLNIPDEQSLLGLKDKVLECLYFYLPKETNAARISHIALTEAYVAKLTKVWDNRQDGDRWSLISLSNAGGLNIELKFVDNMKRKFQFSVDSFQIILNEMLQFSNISHDTMTKDFYPSVTVESMYGDIHEALVHLNHRLIATHSASHIKGGGLLKYCDLMSKGYSPTYDATETENIEKTMCTRFIIDYPNPHQQHWKISNYLQNHMISYPQTLNLLSILYDVVRNRSICLMGYERQQSLDIICGLMQNVQCEHEMQFFFWQYDSACSDGESMIYSVPPSISPSPPSSVVDMPQTPSTLCLAPFIPLSI